MIAAATLEELERLVEAALDGDESGSLRILGYGEISTVLEVDGTGGRVAAKRLPPMTRAQFHQYEIVLREYVEQLEAAGITAVASEVHAVGDDPVTPYCVQPLQHRLLVDALTTADTAQVTAWMRNLTALVTAAADGRIGIDGQLSNWAVAEDGSLLYFDVTTPLLRDGSGTERCDLDLFIASLPWALRSLVKRFLLAEILSHYYSPRPVLLDAAGNLHKEKLSPLIEPLLAAANETLTEPIADREVNRYYRSDARMWGLLQVLRRLDRWWQHRIRRRRYPFLLPGKIER